MKNFVLILFVLLGNELYSQNQNSKLTSWFDVFANLIPNESVANAGSWQSATGSTGPIQWNKQKPAPENQVWSISGNFKIKASADGTFIPGEISLQGKNQDLYTAFRMNSYVSRFIDYASDIDNLLKGKSFSSKLLKQFKTDSYSLYVYELLLPGKKTVWMYIHQYWVGKIEEGGPSSDAIDIQCYLDKNEYSLRSQLDYQQLISSLQILFINKGSDSYSENENGKNVGSVKNEYVGDKILKNTNLNTNATNESLVPLSAVANMLFQNVKCNLSNVEKNDVANKTTVSTSDTIPKNKKGKSKVEYTIYPTDLNNDGVEEIFLCITNNFLGIPTNNYSFYAKDNSGNYNPTPGKIGLAVKIIKSNKRGYPDLLTGIPGFPRELWGWNGRNYILQQKLSGDTKLNYELKNIEKVSQERSLNPVRTESQSSFDLFDGEWHSPVYNYSFRISGKEGIATMSNSHNYKVGDKMIIIKNQEGEIYHGQQIYTDGRWHDVTLMLQNNEIVMVGGVTWKMQRVK